MTDHSTEPTDSEELALQRRPAHYHSGLGDPGPRHTLSASATQESSVARSGSRRPEMSSPSPARAHEIDGIRGWASFSVLLYHVFHQMFTAVVPWINSAWLAPFLQSRLAVCVFFVLSGDALTTTFLARGGRDPRQIDRLVVRRYTRLTIPIFMSCALAFILRLAHADFHDEASVILKSTIWLGQVIEFPFSTIGLLRYSLLGVYTGHSNAVSYNPFLWTMSLEMVGSMLVFLTCYLWPRLRNGKAVLAAIALGLFVLNSFLCLFLAGMLLGQLRAESFFVKVSGGKHRQLAWLAAFLALALLLVATYERRLPLFFDLGMAIAIVFVLYSQRGLRNFLRGRLSTWVGDLSFPIYLVQFAMMISFESWLVIVWNAHGAGTGWLPLIGVATVCATLPAAWLFRQAEKTALAYVDSLVLRVLRRD
jgi:peptidoglycan/LPS O-acetylase OafA/YrhL